MKRKANTSYPTAGQLYALELAARRARNAEIARLFASAVNALKHRVALLLNTKGVRHA